MKLLVLAIISYLCATVTGQPIDACLDKAINCYDICFAAFPSLPADCVSYCGVCKCTEYKHNPDFVKLCKEVADDVNTPSPKRKPPRKISHHKPRSKPHHKPHPKPHPKHHPKPVPQHSEPVRCTCECTGSCEDGSCFGYNCGNCGVDDYGECQSCLYPCS